MSASTLGDVFQAARPLLFQTLAGWQRFFARRGSAPEQAQALAGKALHQTMLFRGLDDAAAAALREAVAAVGLTVVAGTDVVPGEMIVAGPERAWQQLAVRLGLASAATNGVAQRPWQPGPPPPVRYRHRDGWRELPFGQRTYIMGILNLTTDSFSDDGLGDDIDRAVQRAHEMVAAGADILDIGAEASEARETGQPVDVNLEAERVVRLIERLKGEVDAILSIDTCKAPVAEAALAAGAHIINDVTALQGDEGMAAVVARAGCPVVLMHEAKLDPAEDLLDAIHADLLAAIDAAVDAGIAEEQIILDAGFGMSKGIPEDLESTRRLRELTGLGRPLLHAPSRKRTIGRILGYPDTVEERLLGTAAACFAGIAGGADILRVHDVLDMVRLARMADALVRGYPAAEGDRPVV